MKYSLRSTVIYRGEKWIVERRPDIFQRIDRYTLAQPDSRGFLSMHSRRTPNVLGLELQQEVDLCA